ncbi:MAG TPA: malonic semialdehyde reductase [Candidatus Cybelea sp.]|nr:malonic semialdehyde reductase [Candidatus Cybelea sp.]
MPQILSDSGLDLIFRAARTHNVWTDKPVSEVMLKALYELLKMAPTTANSNPARFRFLVSPEAKRRLAPALSDANRDKTMQAAAVAIIAYDLDFPSKLPKLFPHRPEAVHWYNDAKFRETTAFRNGTLQGAYLILAARALGLDCGPMSGFDNAKVDAEFFAGTTIKSNFLCSLGYGDHSKLFPRNPRLDFDEACKIL